MKTKKHKQNKTKQTNKTEEEWNKRNHDNSRYGWCTMRNPGHGYWLACLTFLLKTVRLYSVQGTKLQVVAQYTGLCYTCSYRVRGHANCTQSLSSTPSFYLRGSCSIPRIR